MCLLDDQLKRQLGHRVAEETYICDQTFHVDICLFYKPLLRHS